MAFEFTDAVRERVPLMVGLCGGPGAGKTLSALKLAKGMQAVNPGPICVIDTEGGRSTKYVDFVPFKKIIMRPPFNPARFGEAIQAALKLNPACIIVDSMSDEHEGEGGVLAMHDTELDRMAGNDWAKRERVTQAAWIKPKAERKALVNSLYQITTPLIFCFRAREKTKQVKNDRGKMEPTNIGWQPIAPSEIVHAMDVMAVLPLKSDGVPLWHSEKVGEDFVIKHPIQFRDVLPEGAPLSEDMGRRLAAWAAGGTVQPSASPAADRAPASEPALWDGVDQEAGASIDAEIAARFRSLLPAMINEHDDAEKLADWWNSDGQKKQRAELLTAEERREFSDAVKRRHAELRAQAAA